jgi:hypothetical protein
MLLQKSISTAGISLACIGGACFSLPTPACGRVFNAAIIDPRKGAGRAKKTDNCFFAVFAPLRENCFLSRLPAPQLLA